MNGDGRVVIRFNKVLTKKKKRKSKQKLKRKVKKRKKGRGIQGKEQVK